MTWKHWLQLLANAFVSGAIAGSLSAGLGIGAKRAALVALGSGLVSAGKWYLQHPPPGVPEEKEPTFI